MATMDIPVSDKRNNNYRKITLNIFTLIKFALPVVFACLSTKLTQNPLFPIVMFIESLLVFLLTNLIAIKTPVTAYVIGVILLFVIYAQSVVLNFAGRFVQLIMLTNLESIEALGGKATVYISSIVLALIVLFLPIRYIGIQKTKLSAAILCICFIAVCWIPFVYTKYSTYANTYDLILDAKYHKEAEERIVNLMSGNSSLSYDEFYSDSIGDGIGKPSNLPSDPNIVLIFTEGLSRHIIDDPRDIMPNVSYYLEHGLSFENYYDHTAATLRGIIGQLYSSHQYNNLDSNNLISIQEILEQRGYETIFVNPEPDNDPFTEHLCSFEFSNLTSGSITNRSLTDNETYEVLFDEFYAAAESGNPVFAAVYTYGTHVTFDSDENRFGDGSNRLLNRFHNSDAAFGEFMSRLQESGYASDTIVVYTADHATYVDDDYVMTFDNPRTDSFCDTIPFFIYYEGIDAQSVDAEGRNSLDLVPTILDYIDVDSPNFFLGSSLFLPMNNPELETVFCVPDYDWRVNTANGELSPLMDDELSYYNEVLERYLALTQIADVPS